MKTIILSTFLTIFSFSATAQEIISNGGDSFNNGSIQLDFTLGELATETLSNNVDLTQGFHQGHFAITSIKEEAPLEFKVHPNPTNDWIQFNGNEALVDVVAFEVYDLYGRVIEKQVNSNAQDLKISLGNLVAGTYFIQLILNDPKNSAKPIKITKQ